MNLNAFYGIKMGQTQSFTAEGVRIPVTKIFVEPMTVVQVKSKDKDGYVSLKVAFGKRKAKNISKPVQGEIAKIANFKFQISNRKSKNNEEAASEEVKKETKEENATILPRYFRELRVKNSEDIQDIKAGDTISIADIFKEGDFLNVSGVTIGKGFAGVVKRHGFRGGPRTHGQADRERAPGSIGQTTTPGRVYKGKRMAGRMGGLQATVKDLKVASFEADRNIINIKGLVPGKKKGVVKLYK